MPRTLACVASNSALVMPGGILRVAMAPKAPPAPINAPLIRPEKPMLETRCSAASDGSPSAASEIVWPRPYNEPSTKPAVPAVRVFAAARLAISLARVVAPASAAPFVIAPAITRSATEAPACPALAAPPTRPPPGKAIAEAIVPPTSPIVDATGFASFSALNFSAKPKASAATSDKPKVAPRAAATPAAKSGCSAATSRRSRFCLTKFVSRRKSCRALKLVRLSAS